MRDDAAVSYTWVLKRFRDLFIGVQTSNVIVTNQDEGLSSVICDGFSDIFQFLLTIYYFI